MAKNAKKTSNAVKIYIGRTKLGSGKGEPELDNTLRKPFPNMVSTKTGKH